MDAELAIVQAQMAHVASLQGQREEALQQYAQILALNLHSDLATQALCTNNHLVLRTQKADGVPKARRTSLQESLKHCSVVLKTLCRHRMGGDVKPCQRAIALNC
jgi:dTDP-4-amino-4,6-dideoxygalactose transaminase